MDQKDQKKKGLERQPTGGGKAPPERQIYPGTDREPLRPKEKGQKRLGFGGPIRGKITGEVRAHQPWRKKIKEGQSITQKGKSKGARRVVWTSLGV